MKFVLFPESANKKSGYNIVVAKDFKKIVFNEGDKILWCQANENSSNLYRRDGDYLLIHPSKYSLKKLKNLFLGRLINEVDTSEIKKYYEEMKNADEIWCDDYVFYRSIRKLMPRKRLYVRFHNLHYRNFIRAIVYKVNLDLKYRLIIIACSKIEKEIFKDCNAIPIFISNEDQIFYELTTKRNDSLLWKLELNDDLIKKSKNNSKLNPITKIVFFGGLTAHKVKSINFFIKNIWKRLLINYPYLEFHMFGKGTEKFNSRSKKIFGHGFYNCDTYPYKDCSIYINPDLIGGGVKVKVADLLENAIPFITNEFGYEGYDKKYIDKNYCCCVPLDEWINEIERQILFRYVVENN